MKTAVSFTLLIIEAFFSFPSCAIDVKDFLTYNRYDLEKLVKTEEIVTDSINSIRIAADCMYPLINNMTQIVKTLNLSLINEDIPECTHNFRFLANYIRGHVMNISQVCFHAKSKIEVMLQTLAYMESICNNVDDIFDSYLDRFALGEIYVKKHLNNFIFEMALIEQFFYDSCDKIMTPVTFIDDRNRDLRLHAKRIDEFTKLLVNETGSNDIDVRKLFRGSKHIYLAADQMTNITEKIKIASDNLFVGKEAINNITINSTQKFSGYKMIQSNFIILITRSVSAFMKVTRQRYVSSNTTESQLNNKVLDDGIYENSEAEIKTDKRVCDYPRISLEINNKLEKIYEDNTNVLNISMSINEILRKIRRETPTNKETSKTLKRDAIRITILLRDIKYRTNYLMSLITTCYPDLNITRDAEECEYYCADEIKPVCGIDRNLGYAVFLNKCLLYGHNKCKRTQYHAFDVEMCMQTRMRDVQSFKFLGTEN